METSCVCGTPRGTALFLHTEAKSDGRRKAQHELRLKLWLSTVWGYFSAVWFHQLGCGYAMLAQRNGLPPGSKPAALKDPPVLPDVDQTAPGCCSFSPSPGGCPWARLAGVDGCLSEPYCLWFQFLARAYWGEVELGLASPNHSVSWARFKDASRKSCVRVRVRWGRYRRGRQHQSFSEMWRYTVGLLRDWELGFSSEAALPRLAFDSTLGLTQTTNLCLEVAFFRLHPDRC